MAEGRDGLKFLPMVLFQSQLQTFVGRFECSISVPLLRLWEVGKYFRKDSHAEDKSLDCGYGLLVLMCLGIVEQEGAKTARGGPGAGAPAEQTCCQFMHLRQKFMVLLANFSEGRIMARFSVVFHWSLRGLIVIERMNAIRSLAA